MASTLRVSEAVPAVSRAPSRLSGTDLALLLMALLWGVNFIVVKYGTRVVAPLAFNTARMALAVALLWMVVGVQRLSLPPRADLGRLVALGVLGNGLYQILFILGIARTRAGDAALLVSAAPAFIEAIHWVQGRETTGKRGLLGIAISVAGIGLVVFGAAHASAGESTLAGNLLMLGAALCWALYSVGLKPFTDRLSPITLSSVTMTGGLLAMLLVSAPSIRATDWQALDGRGWGAVLYSGVLAMFFAYLLWYRGVRVLGATRTSMYVNLQPVVAMTVAAMFLGERPHALQLVGAACILGGLLLTRLAAPAAAGAA